MALPAYLSGLAHLNVSSIDEYASFDINQDLNDNIFNQVHWSYGLVRKVF